MKAIKTFLTILYGAFMASCIWIFVYFPTKTNSAGIVETNGWTIPFIILFALSCIATLFVSIVWLLEHWNDD